MAGLGLRTQPQAQSQGQARVLAPMATRLGPVSGLVIGASTGLEHRQWEPGSAQFQEETLSLEMVRFFIGGGLGGAGVGNPGSPCSQDS